MEFKVTTALRKLNAMTTRKKVVQGGTSAGKTFNIIPLLINKAITTPQTEISVVSESIPHLRRGALKDFTKIMIATGRWRSNNYNKSLLKYTFSNGSYIEFFSADQDDKLRGARRNVLYVNEANNIPFESYNQLAIRTSGDIWIDFNPTSRFWAHSEVLSGKDASLIILTYKDNEALPQTIIDELLEAKEKSDKGIKYWQNWWRVYGEGQIGNLEGACISNWEVLEELPEDARLLCYGMDFGYSNDPTTLIGLYKYNGTYIFNELIYKTKLLNRDISNALKELKISDLDIIYADSAEPKSIAELKTYKHMVEPCTKGRDSIVYGINLINQQEKILVTKQSKNLVNELQSYIWMKDKEGNTINKPQGGNDHCIDAMRYALSSYLKNPNAGVYNIW